MAARALRYADRPRRRARPRPQGRAEHRHDDGPLAGPGRAVQPGALRGTLCDSRNGLGGQSRIGARSAVNSSTSRTAAARASAARSRHCSRSSRSRRRTGPPPLPTTSSQTAQAVPDEVREARGDVDEGCGVAAGPRRPDARRPAPTNYAQARHRRPALPVGRDQRTRQLQLPAAVRAVHLHQGDPAGGPVRRARDDDDVSRSARARSSYSGTDDDVYLRIGPNLRFPLDKTLYDDFERGDRDTYSVPIDAAVLNGLKVGDISRVQIEKSPDGVGGGWRLKGREARRQRPHALRAQRDRALARGRPSHVARPGLRPERAGRTGAAGHARPLGRGLIHLRR